MSFIVQSTITTSITALLILLIKFVFKDRLSPRWHMFLWLLLFVRVLIPFLPESEVSVFNKVPEINFEEINEYQTVEDTNDINYENININQQVSESGVNEIDFEKIWYIGIFLGIAYFIIVYILFSIKVNKYIVCRSDDILELLEICKNKMGVYSKIDLRIGGNTPMIKGIFRQQIIIPEGYSMDEMKQIFLHELCHLKHRDIITNIVLVIINCIYWFNPIMWYVSKTIRRDVEILCDWRVTQLSENRKLYAKVLLKSALKRNSFILGTTCMQNGESQIKRRIKMIANLKKPKVIYSIIAIVGVVLISIFCLTNKIDQNTSGNAVNKMLETAWNYKTDYIGDPSKVVGIISSIPLHEYYRGVELKTDKEPFGVQVNYVLDKEIDKNIIDNIKRNAVVALSLIKNANYIQFRILDDKNQESIYKYEKKYILYLPNINKKEKDKFVQDINKYFNFQEGKDFKVVIDAGHGGHDTGGIGTNGVYEKDVNLQLSKLVYKYFSTIPNLSVKMTRSEDKYISLNQRKQIINDFDADLAISIHMNTSTDTSLNGFEMYYGMDENKGIAEKLNSYLQFYGIMNNNGIKKNDSILLLNNVEVPTFIYEMGYITNVENKKKILGNGAQHISSRNIVRSVISYISEISNKELKVKKIEIGFKGNPVEPYSCIIKDEKNIKEAMRVYNMLSNYKSPLVETWNEEVTYIIHKKNGTIIKKRFPFIRPVDDIFENIFKCDEVKKQWSKREEPHNRKDINIKYNKIDSLSVSSLYINNDIKKMTKFRNISSPKVLAAINKEVSKIKFVESNEFEKQTVNIIEDLWYDFKINVDGREVMFRIYSGEDIILFDNDNIYYGYDEDKNKDIIVEIATLLKPINFDE